MSAPFEETQKAAVDKRGIGQDHVDEAVERYEVFVVYPNTYYVILSVHTPPSPGRGERNVFCQLKSKHTPLSHNIALPATTRCGFTGF